MWLLATHLASSSQVKAGSSGAVFSSASAQEEPIKLPLTRVLAGTASPLHSLEAHEY